MKQCTKNMNTEKYQAPRTAGLCFYQDKLRLTTGGHTHRQNTRNVCRSGRAKCWHQLGTSTLVQQEGSEERPLSCLELSHTTGTFVLVHWCVSLYILSIE